MANDPALSLEDFIAALPANTRLIGLDLGTKTIGLALSDLGRGIASPMGHHPTQENSPSTQKQLLDICARQEVGGIVLGLPLNMDGSEGPRAQATRAFARNLSQKTDLPITYWDERLSTAAVTRTLLEADSSRAKRAGVVDKMAAAFILQGFLDRLGFMGTDR